MDGLSLELHSMLANSSGSITEARRAELELECSTRRHVFVGNTSLTHLTHTLSLLIAVMSCLHSPMYTGSVECYTDLSYH